VLRVCTAPLSRDLPLGVVTKHLLYDFQSRVSVKSLLRTISEYLWGSRRAAQRDVAWSGTDIPVAS